MYVSKTARCCGAGGEASGHRHNHEDQAPQQAPAVHPHLLPGETPTHSPGCQPPACQTPPACAPRAPLGSIPPVALPYGPQPAHDALVLPPLPQDATIAATPASPAKSLAPMSGHQAASGPSLRGALRGRDGAPTPGADVRTAQIQNCVPTAANAWHGYPAIVIEPYLWPDLHFLKWRIIVGVGMIEYQ